MQTTREGQLKGKLSYMAPEQIGGEVTRQTDIYATGIVLWELLTAQRLFAGENEGQILQKVVSGNYILPSQADARVPQAFDPVVVRALAARPQDRFSSAREMAIAVERAVGVASSTEVSEWIESVAYHTLSVRAHLVAEIESASGITDSHLIEAGTQLATPSSGAALEPPPHSQASSVSLSRPAEPPPKKPWWILAIGLVGIVVGIVGIVFVVRQPPANEQSTALPSLPPPTPPVASSITAVAAPTPIETVSAAPSATPVKTAAPKPAVRPTATHDDCTPPYTLDDQGHKHWKEKSDLREGIMSLRDSPGLRRRHHRHRETPSIRRRARERQIRRRYDQGHLVD
jgi:serine/threonine-protein kinase